jgi:opacity protein-like surface antigen
MFFKKVFAFSLALFLGMSGASFAMDRTGRTDIGIYGAGALHDQSGVDDSGYLGGNFSYGMTPMFALGAEVGWQEADIQGGEIGIVPIYGDLILRIPTGTSPFPAWQEALVPYGILGLGAVVTYIDREGNNPDDVAFGWKLGAGADWFLNNQWALNFEAAYHNSDDVDDDTPATVTSLDELDYWTVGGGLKFVF